MTAEHSLRTDGMAGCDASDHHVLYGPSDQVPSDLADLISEFLVWQPSRLHHAAAVHELVACAVDAIRWRHEPVGDALEEPSLDALLSATRDRVQRMSLTGALR